jgi:hypothetical protein
MLRNEAEYWNELFNQDSHQSRMLFDCRWVEQDRPSTKYKPRLFIDGDMWCALYGDNLQDGVCAFGKSPSEAFKNFDIEWEKSIK